MKKISKMNPSKRKAGDIPNSRFALKFSKRSASNEHEKSVRTKRPTQDDPWFGHQEARKDLKVMLQEECVFLRLREKAPAAVKEELHAD